MKTELSGNREKWSCDGIYIIDEAGNKYDTKDLEESFYGRKLYKEITGTQYKIRILKEHLIKEKEKYSHSLAIPFEVSKMIKNLYLRINNKTV